MWRRIMSKLARVTQWFKRDRNKAQRVTAGDAQPDAPLDLVERLQRDGMPLSVLIEFARRGW